MLEAKLTNVLTTEAWRTGNEAAADSTPGTEEPPASTDKPLQASSSPRDPRSRQRVVITLVVLKAFFRHH